VVDVLSVEANALGGEFAAPGLGFFHEGKPEGDNMFKGGELRGPGRGWGGKGGPAAEEVLGVGAAFFGEEEVAKANGVGHEA